MEVAGSQDVAKECCFQVNTVCSPGTTELRGLNLVSR